MYRAALYVINWWWWWWWFIDWHTYGEHVFHISLYIYIFIDWIRTKQHEHT